MLLFYKIIMSIAAMLLSIPQRQNQRLTSSSSTSLSTATFASRFKFTVHAFSHHPRRILSPDNYHGKASNIMRMMKRTRLMTLNSHSNYSNTLSCHNTDNSGFLSSSSLPSQRKRISTTLYAVESRNLRFYNGSTTSISSPASLREGTTLNKKTIGSSSTSSSTDKDQNKNDDCFSSFFTTTTDTLLDGTSLDLSQQVSYFTSLFQRSISIGNSHESSNNINNPDNNNSNSAIHTCNKFSSTTTKNNKYNKVAKHLFSTKNNKISKSSSAASSNLESNDETNMNQSSSNNNNSNNNKPKIQLTPDEQELFDLLTQVIQSTEITSTLRVAGGWVRDKLLATDEFQPRDNSSRSPNSISGTGTGSGLVDRLTSKYRGPSLGRQGTKLIGLPKGGGGSGGASYTYPLSLVDLKDLPVDIDIALDDMLGREFADHLNDWLTQHGQETISVGVVLKNPEKSKHLETATMKVGKFWIDFVNLRAEEYTEDSRIPDLMRIGTAEEDAFRRDLTINALFYNINTGEVEDFTGRGFDDLKKGVVATPLPALTTLLDDPLRVLRSVRFAARLRFTMEESLREAATNEKVRVALAQKVARERIGAEVDLMLRSQDPVGAMRLLINLNLAGTVFPMDDLTSHEEKRDLTNEVFTKGLNLLSTTHDHLVDCKVNVPIWCEKKRVTASANYGVNEVVLMEDEELRRKLWYASFLKPLRDKSLMVKNKEKVGRRQGKKATRSVIMKLMVDDLKRPVRDAETVENIMKGADEINALLNAGCDLTATACLLGDVRVIKSGFGGDPDGITCFMGGKIIDCETEKDPLWEGAMEYRLLASKPLKRLGHLWRAAVILSLSQQLAALEDEDMKYTIEGDVFEETQEEKRIGLVQTFDTFAASLLQLGLVGVWSQQPLIDGKAMKSEVLCNIPKGPVFREIMEEQEDWMITHPGGSKDGLIVHLREVFSEYI